MPNLNLARRANTRIEAIFVRRRLGRSSGRPPRCSACEDRFDPSVGPMGRRFCGSPPHLPPGFTPPPPGFNPLTPCAVATTPLPSAQVQLWRWPCADGAAMAVLRGSPAEGLPPGHRFPSPGVPPSAIVSFFLPCVVQPCTGFPAPTSTGQCHAALQRAPKLLSRVHI